MFEKKLNMIKSTLILFFVIFLLPSVAQEHLQFQGMALDGDADSFAQKISALGWKYSEHHSTLTKNSMVYDGTLFGEKVYLSMSLTPVTKKVYGVQLFVWPDSNNTLDALEKEMIANLLKEYPNSDTLTTKGLDGEPCFAIYVKDAASSSRLGVIAVMQEGIPKIPILVVNFYDEKNSKINSDEKAVGK